MFFSKQFSSPAFPTTQGMINIG